MRMESLNVLGITNSFEERFSVCGKKFDDDENFGDDWDDELQRVQ